MDNPGSSSEERRVPERPPERRVPEKPPERKVPEKPGDKKNVPKPGDKKKTDDKKSSGKRGSNRILSLHSRDIAVRPVRHPFQCRIKDSQGFCVSKPQSLIGAGFASLSVAVFSFFRPTPTLLVMFTSPWDSSIPSRTLFWVILWTWCALLLIVLFLFGLFLVGSMHIRKRWILLLHPWGLLLLYFDVIVWVGLTITVHMRATMWPDLCPLLSGKSQHPLVFYVVMYLECICFALLYYFYATFFISAELTVIEKYFP